MLNYKPETRAFTFEFVNRLF